MKFKQNRGEFSYSNRKFFNKKKKQSILGTKPVKKSKENIPLGEFSNETDKDIKKMLNGWYKPNTKHLHAAP